MDSWAGRGGVAAITMILKRLIELAPDVMSDENYAPVRKMCIRLTGRLQMERREWARLRTSSMHKARAHG